MEAEESEEAAPCQRGIGLQKFLLFFWISTCFITNLKKERHAHVSRLESISKYSREDEEESDEGFEEASLQLCVLKR